MGRRTVLLIASILMAAIGTTLVFLYVRGADQRALAEQRQVEVLRVTQEVPAGTLIADAQADGAFQLVTVAEGSLAPGALADTSEVTDLVMLATLYPGEQLLRAKIGTPQDTERLSIPEGMLGLSFQLSDPARVADFVAPGSEIAVFVTTTTTEGEQAGQQQTGLLLERVTVLAVGATTTATTTTLTPSGEQQTEALPRTILTLALTQEQGQKMVFASQTGQLYFGLLNDTSDVAAAPGTNATNLFGG